MYYPFPKKIQLQPSYAKWSLQSEKSILLIVGIDDLKNIEAWQYSELADHIEQLIKKAHALEIPTLFLNQSSLNHTMMQLGQFMAARPVQLMIAGQVSPLMKQVIQHISSILDEICIIDDAVLALNAEQHIQWIDTLTAQNIHHMNCYSVTRLWSLSAPKELILSSKGVLFAIAEQLNLAPLDIDPEIDLRDYGLDSIEIVTLIGLWRANGANITYEDFLKHCTLEKLFNILNIH